MVHLEDREEEVEVYQSHRQQMKVAADDEEAEGSGHFPMAGVWEDHHQQMKVAVGDKEGHSHLPMAGEWVDCRQ